MLSSERDVFGYETVALRSLQTVMVGEKGGLGRGSTRLTRDQEMTVTGKSKSNAKQAPIVIARRPRPPLSRSQDGTISSFPRCVCAPRFTHKHRAHSLQNAHMYVKMNFQRLCYTVHIPVSNLHQCLAHHRIRLRPRPPAASILPRAGERPRRHPAPCGAHSEDTSWPRRTNRCQLLAIAMRCVYHSPPSRSGCATRDSTRYGA